MSLFRALLPGEGLLFAFMALVAWLPVPLGSNRMLYWSLAEIAAALLFLLWLWQYARGRLEIPIAARRAWPALLLLGLWLAFLTIQILPLPLAVVKTLSPEAARIHLLTYHPGKGPPWVTLSVDPHHTLVSLHKSIALVLLFLLTLLLMRRFAHLRWMARVLFLMGTLQALLAILGYLFGWHFFYSGSATGTFVNRNHFADYLTLTLAAGIGLLLAQLGGASPSRAGRERLRRFLDWIMGAKMRLRAYLLVMTAAVIMTHSRMGNTALFVSLLVAGAAALLLMRRKSRGMVILLASLVVLDIFIMGSMVGLKRVVHRIEQTSLVSETRDEVDRDALVYWRDFPFTGSGLGTFSVLFPRYKGPDNPLHYVHAHDDYLQFATETGAVGLALIGGFVLWTLATALIALRRRRVPWAQGAAFASFMATVALLIHSTVEFNLQIFANAGTYLVLAAMGGVALHLPARRSREYPVQPPRRALLGLTPLLLIYVGWVTLLAASELITASNRQLLKGWMAKGATPAAIEAAIARQQLAIRLAPKSAEAKLVQARLLSFELVGDEKAKHDAGQVQAVRRRIMELLLAATRDSPARATTWVAMAYARNIERNYDPIFRVALLRATRLAPWETSIQRDLVRLGLLAWPRLPDTASRRLILDALRRGLQERPREMIKLVKKLHRRKFVCAIPNLPLPETFCRETKKERGRE